ncbi:uncharacterized protein LOC131229106 isoform X2 [Magnolia sinica]|uniref:uncharacterized protein LOC131229106 isoform X2 n=1 Tax=Magnolia sinica TaxID=86752 RepID=UPI00265943E8|nr:uncharacterized protein LOC131229106 isoform X2 [Magnolia sinica]
MTFRKSFLPRIFSSKEKTISQTDEDSFDSSVEFERTLTFSATPPSFRKSLSVAESESTSRLRSLNFSNFQSQMSDISDRRDFRPWHAFRKSPTDIAKKRNLHCAECLSSMLALVLGCCGGLCSLLSIEKPLQRFLYSQ